MWSSLSLTVGKAPVLWDGESVAAEYRSVAVYNCNSSDNQQLIYQSGWLYITSARVCYVESLQPEENSCWISLNQIQSYKFIDGNFRKSAKIQLQISKSQTESVSAYTWICSICSFSNTLSLKYVPGQSELPTCSNCGVQCWEPPEFQKYETHDSTVCPRCTFKNHPFMRECEICGLTLKQVKHFVPLNDTIRLSFRSGGADDFLIKLVDLQSKQDQIQRDTDFEEGSLPQKEKDLAVGISRLAFKPESQAVTDINALNLDAERLLKVESRINPNYFVAYRIEGQLVYPSKDTEGYYIRLASQISDFLESNQILANQGGLMSLQHVFAAYNRARGIDTISAADMVKALELAPSLNMPIKIRTLKNGTMMLDSNSWVSSQDRLVSWIKKSEQGVSALNVATHFGWSLYIASEELEQSEMLGKISRDETFGGVQFYPNLFAS